MAELLGDALLSIRTDDKDFGASVAAAEARTKGLGSAMDAASGSATALGEKLTEAGASGATAGRGLQGAQTATTGLAEAQAEARAATTALGQAQAAASAAVTDAKAAVDASRQAVSEYTAEVEAARAETTAVANTTTALSERLTDAAKSSDAVMKAYQATQAAIVKLAAAQVETVTIIREAKAALDAGTISQQRYNETVLEARAALSSVEREYRTSIDVLRQQQDALDAGTKVTGQQRLGMMVLGEQLRQVSTELSLGISPAQVFSQQIGQIIDATQLAIGGTGKFAAFMQGPWGIALTAGAAVLLPFLGNLLLAGNALDSETEKLKKNAEQTQAARKAKEEFKHTEEGVIAAINDQKAALDKQAESLGTVADVALQNAQRNQQDIIKIREKTVAILELQRSELRQAESQSFGAAGGAGAGMAVAMYADQVKQAEKDVKDATDALAQAQKNVAEYQSQVSVEAGVRSADPAAAIKRLYEGPDGLIEQARKRAVAEGKVGAELERQVAALKAQEQAKLKQAQAEKSDSNRQFGRDIDFREARSIAESAGFRVTDDFRTRAEQQHLYDTVRTPENPVAKPGTSAHEKGNALDIAFGSGVDVESIRKAFADAGVRLTKILKETGHYHIEFSTAAADKEAAAEKKAQDDAVRRQAVFSQANDQLDAQIAAAKRASLTDLGAIAQLNEQQLRAEQDRFIDDLESKVKLKELTRADADKLELKQAELTHLKEMAILQETQAEKIRRQAQLDSELSQHQTEILQAQLALAKTAEERRAIQLQLLDAEKKEAQRRYQETIDLGRQGKATPEQVKAAQDGLDKLDTVYDLRRQDVERQTAGPLEAYLTSIKLSAAQIRERSENLAVQELEYFRQGIDQAITSRLGIKDPLLAGLVDMLVEQWLIKPLTEALAKMSGGPGGGGGIGGLLGSIFGGGGGAGSSEGPVFGGGAQGNPDGILSFQGLFADGGLIPSGGWGIVGEAGPEPIFATAGGVGVLPNSALRTMGAGASSSRPDKIEVTVSGARGNAEIQQMVQQGVMQGIAAYDRQVGERVRDNLSRRG